MPPATEAFAAGMHQLLAELAPRIAACILLCDGVVVAARICGERTDGGGQAHHSSDVRPAEEHPVVGRPDGDVGAVGEPVDDDRDHGEAEAEDEDEQVLRACGAVRQAERWRWRVGAARMGDGRAPARA